MSRIGKTEAIEVFDEAVTRRSIRDVAVLSQLAREARGPIEREALLKEIIRRTEYI